VPAEARVVRGAERRLVDRGDVALAPALGADPAAAAQDGRERGESASWSAIQ